MTINDPVISGRAFLLWLIDNGVIPDRSRRVVIDASYDSIVAIYVETVGTEKLIKVEVPTELVGATKVILE